VQLDPTCQLSVNHQSNSFVLFVRERNMVNSVKSGVFGYDAILEESLIKALL